MESKTLCKSQTRLYHIWANMRERCSNKNGKEFHCYGGRGITVCQEWEKSFESFKEWALANGYAENLTIDRINNDSNYSPENCRWITLSENSKHVFENPMRKQSNSQKFIEWYVKSKHKSQ